MSYYLLKTEPTVYGFADLQKEQSTIWDGVTNPVAVKHLRAMQKSGLPRSELALDARRATLGERPHLARSGHRCIAGKRGEQRAVSPAQLD